MKGRPQLERFGFAWTGIRIAWKREISFRTEVIIGLIVFPWLFWRGTPIAYILILAGVAALGLVAELLNTAVEAVCDVAHPDPHPLVKVAKDCAAGAVLIANATALVLLVTIWWITR